LLSVVSNIFISKVREVILPLPLQSQQVIIYVGFINWSGKAIK
jgi:hypothetical protein